VPTDNSNVKKFNGLSAFTAMLPDSPSSDYDLYKAESDAQNRWNQYYGKPVMDQVKDAEAALNAHVLERQRPVRYDNTGSEDSIHETSELDGSEESESLSHDYKESVTDISDNLDESAESELPSPLKTRRSDKLQRYKRSSYIPPKESKEDRTKATARISKALDQVPLSVHLNPQGKRKTATLYVGNLAFNAS
jgi:hypothetical protein